MQKPVAFEVEFVKNRGKSPDVKRRLEKAQTSHSPTYYDVMSKIAKADAKRAQKLADRTQKKRQRFEKAYEHLDIIKHNHEERTAMKKEMTDNRMKDHTRKRDSHMEVQLKKVTGHLSKVEEVIKRKAQRS